MGIYFTVSGLILKRCSDASGSAFGSKPAVARKMASHLPKFTPFILQRNYIFTGIKRTTGTGLFPVVAFFAMLPRFFFQRMFINGLPGEQPWRPVYIAG